MDIWIIQNGEKSGPLHDFEIRRKIENGELPATTPAWHEGLAAWKPLVEIDLFTREFDKPTPPADDNPYAAPDQESDAPVPPPLPNQAHLIRRFWARWLDLFLFSSIWWITMWAVGRDIGLILNNQWVMLLHYIPWFALETFLIHRFGTTPGKWLLGIKVVNNDGSLLTLAEATRRSSRVLFIGLGFGWGILALICQIMAWITTKRLGRPLWDHAGGHRLETTPIRPVHLMAYAFVLIFSLVLQFSVLFPFALKQAEKDHPEYKEQWEKLRRDFEGKSEASS